MISTITGILILTASVSGSFIQRVCGFGFGIFIMTILPHLLTSLPEATALSGFLSMIQSSLVLISVYKHLHIKNLIGIFVVFCITSFFAIRFVGSTDNRVLEIILGSVLICLAVYFLFFSKQNNVTPTLKWQIPLGSLSGIMGGLFGMHGPAAVAYFLPSEKTKENYLAIAQAYFVITNIYMSIIRAGNGFVTSNVGYGLLWALPGIIIGIYLGKRVFDKVNPDLLKKIIYFYMIVAGIIQIIG